MSSTPTPAPITLRFAGMRAPESLIFATWEKLHGKEYDHFDFNVRVGKGDDPGAAFPDIIRQQAIKNTQHKIDAIGYKGNQVTIIEVKDRANFGVIGQVLGYRELWQGENPGLPAPLILVLCSALVADVGPVMAKYGIPLQVVLIDRALIG